MNKRGIRSSYEEDYEKARVLLREATMAPEEVKHPKLQKLALWSIYLIVILIIATVILGALGWLGYVALHSGDWIPPPYIRL